MAAPRGGLITPCNPDVRCQQPCHRQREQRGGLKFSCSIGRIWHLVLVPLWLGHLTFLNNLKQVHWKTIPCQELMMSRLITVLGSSPPDPSGEDLKVWLRVNNKACHVDNGFLWIPANAFPKQNHSFGFQCRRLADFKGRFSPPCMEQHAKLESLEQATALGPRAGDGDGDKSLSGKFFSSSGMVQAECFHL